MFCVIGQAIFLYVETYCPNSKANVFGLRVYVIILYNVLIVTHLRSNTVTQMLGGKGSGRVVNEEIYSC